MIHLRQVYKSFGPIRAVNGLSFEIHAGQCVGLLGPNGAGKSTTLRMITGFTPPSAGTISIGGKDTVADSLAARRQIGYLPESTPLYPEMRVRDYLAFRASLYGMARPESRKAISEALGICRIQEVERRRIGHLSKGYRQRVGLAAALVHKPPVLILDEPTNGLDPSQIRETRSLIRDLASNRTVLVSSHILPEIEKTCDRVIIMARGSVRADGAPGELVGRFGRSVGYVAEVRAEAAEMVAVTETIKRIVGVGAVTTTLIEPVQGWVRVAVGASVDAPDLREAIGRAFSTVNLPVRELTRSAATLEHVFVRLTDDEPVASEQAA